MDSNGEYVQNEAVEIIRSLPRFGYGKDISQFFSSDQNEQLDYVYGVTYNSILLFVGLIAWLIILLTLKCLGPTRVGFLSGSRFFDADADDDKSPIPCYRPNLVRTLFITYSVCLLCFCGLLVTKGSLHYDDTITFFKASVVEISDLMADSYAVTTFLIGVGIDAADIRDKALVSLANFCPNGNVEEIFGTKVDPYELVEDLSDLSDFTVNRSEEAREQINDIQMYLEEADYFLEKTLVWKGYSLHIVLPIAALTSILVAGTLLASAGFTNVFLENIQSWVVMPLLLFISIVFWLITVLFGTVAILNADLCSGGLAPGSPDDTILDIMDRFNIRKSNEDIYNIVEHYVKACRTDDPFGFLQKYEDQLDDSLISADQFLQGVEETGNAELEKLCGASLEDDLKIIVDLRELLIRLAQKTGDMMDLIDCGRINNIYTLSVHNGTCSSLVFASGWITLSLFVISFTGMILITIRSSWLGTDIYDEDEDVEVDVDSFVKNRDSSIYSQSVTSEPMPYSPNNIRSPQSALSYNDESTYDEYPTPEQPQAYESSGRGNRENEDVAIPPSRSWEDQPIEEVVSSKSWENADLDVASDGIEVLQPDNAEGNENLPASHNESSSRAFRESQKFRWIPKK